nr:MAG TPA: putative tRNA pseudouridine synthase B [Caudoviricetes sp.]
MLKLNKTYFCDHCESCAGPIKPKRCSVCGLLFTKFESVKIKNTDRF